MVYENPRNNAKIKEINLVMCDKLLDNGLGLRNFRHFTFLFRFFTAKTTFANLILEHGIIGCTSASELITRDDMSDIDKEKRNAKDDKNDEKGK